MSRDLIEVWLLWLSLICCCCCFGAGMGQRIRRLAGGMPVTDSDDLQTSVVSLRSRSEQLYYGDSHFCTGCLLNDIFILTAAQCVTRMDKVAFQPRDMIVMAGNKYRLNSSSGAVPLMITFLAVHENFTTTSYSDIAILRTKLNIQKYNPHIDVVPVDLQPPPYGSECIVMGWGRLFRDGPLSSAMNVLTVTLYTPEYCRELIPEMHDDMLCAGNIDANGHMHMGPCPGDTGGPLFCNGSLTGIVSHTVSCSYIHLPSIYTNVYHHREWIYEYVDRGGQARLHSLELAYGQASVLAIIIFLAMMSWHNSIVC